VTSLPRDHVTVGPLGTYSLTFREERGVIRVRRALRVRPVTLSPGQYPELIRWVKEVDRAEARRIRLTHQP